MIDYLKKHIIWVIVFGFLLVGLAFGAGLLVKNWPLLTLDTEFKISDVIDVVISVIIALLIPVYIKYFIDKGSKVNEMILSEIERYRTHLDQTHERFFAIYQSGTLTDDNKAEINIYCEMLDAKFETLTSVLKERCKEAADKFVEELKTNQIKFWRGLTNIEINSADVTSIHPTTLTKEVKYHQNLSDTVVKIKLFVTNY